MPHASQADAESLRMELQEAIITFRHQTLLGTQAAGFLITADSLLLAYGFSQRESGILLIASAIPIVLLISYIEILNSSLPIIYVAITLEQKLQLRDAPLAKTFARTYLPQVFTDIGKGDDMTDPSVRESILDLSWRRWLVNRPTLIMFSAFIIQFGLFLCSFFAYHYRFM